MSKYKLYVPEDSSWSEILTEYQLALHKLEKASLTDKGHVQLSNDLLSTSDELAATINTVRLAMDQAKTHATDLINDLVGGAPQTADTLKEIYDMLQDLENTEIAGILTSIANIQTALITKTEVGHAHLASDISDLTTSVETIINAMTLILNISNITGLQIELDKKLEASDLTTAITPLQTSITDTQNDLLALTTTVNGLPTTQDLTDTLDSAKTYSDSIGVSSYNNAKSYTDTQVSTLQSQITSIDRTICFGVDGIVEQNIKTVHLSAPFTSTVKEIHASIGDISGSDLEVTLEKSSDYITWNPVQSLTILAGVYETSLSTFTTPITITKGEKYRVKVTSSNNDVQNLSVNLTVE